MIINFPKSDESGGEDESGDFNIVNPNLIGFIVVLNGDSSHISVHPLAVEIFYCYQNSFILCTPN